MRLCTSGPWNTPGSDLLSHRSVSPTGLFLIARACALARRRNRRWHRGETLYALCPCPFALTAKKPDVKSTSGFWLGDTPGSDLLSHRVSPTVPSAVAGLTSVFGMGTGVALLL